MAKKNTRNSEALKKERPGKVRLPAKNITEEVKTAATDAIETQLTDWGINQQEHSAMWEHLRNNSLSMFTMFLPTEGHNLNQAISDFLDNMLTTMKSPPVDLDPLTNEMIAELSTTKQTFSDNIKARDQKLKDQAQAKGEQSVLETMNCDSCKNIEDAMIHKLIKVGIEAGQQTLAQQQSPGIA